MELVVMYCDNNFVFQERTKHAEMDCHFFQEKVIKGITEPCYIPTKLQITVVFTKALYFPALEFLQVKLSILDIHVPGPCL